MLDIDHLHTAVLLLSPHYHILEVNQACAQLLGTSARHLINQPITQFIHNSAALITILQQALTTQRSHIRQEFSWQLPHRLPPQILQLDLHISRHHSFHTEGLLLEIRLNNTQIAAERSAQAQQQLVIQQELLRNLAHEIKNPLSSIQGIAQLLHAKLAKAALPYETYFAILAKETQRVKQLVEHLLLPNRQALKIETTNVHQICEHVRQVVDSEFSHRITFRRDYDVSIPLIMCDPTLLHQIMLNLLQNAAHALDAAASKNPTIVLKTRVAMQQTLQQKTHPLALQIFISDNGPGIDSEIESRLFKPLVTNKANGHGLGLYLAHQFCVLQGGDLSGYNTTEGATFCVMLPL